MFATSASSPPQVLAPVETEEDKVFDRQVRLWGVETQQRLRSATVLLYGSLGGTAAELAKNLVLAGVNLALCDDEPVEAANAQTNIFLREGDVGTPRAQAMVPRVREMNPHASVSLVRMSDSIASFGSFALVASSGLALGSGGKLEALDASLAKAKVPHIYFDAAGLYGFALVNLGAAYQYKAGAAKDEKASVDYCPFADVFSASWGKFEVRPNRRMPALFFALSLCAQLGGGEAAGEPDAKRARAEVAAAAFDEAKASALLPELVKSRELKHDVDVPAVVRLAKTLSAREQVAPVCAVMGGLLGQEVFKVLGRKDRPVDNCLMFDGTDGAAVVKRVVAGQ